MTALRNNPPLYRSVPGLVLSVGCTLLYGCLGGSGGGPRLGWQEQETVTLTVSDDGADDSLGGMAGAGAEDEPAAGEAGMDDATGEDDPALPRPKIARRTTSDDSVRCGDGHLDADEILRHRDCRRRGRRVSDRLRQRPLR